MWCGNGSRLSHLPRHDFLWLFPVPQPQHILIYSYFYVLGRNKKYKKCKKKERKNTTKPGNNRNGSKWNRKGKIKWQKASSYSCCAFSLLHCFTPFSIFPATFIRIPPNCVINSKMNNARLLAVWNSILFVLCKMLSLFFFLFFLFFCRSWVSFLAQLKHFAMTFVGFDWRTD